MHAEHAGSSPRESILPSLTCSLHSHVTHDLLVSQECRAGFYCPGGIANFTLVCPNGTYSLAGSDDIYDCACPENSDSKRNSQNIMQCVCKPGFFQEYSYLYPPANWWCKPCTPGDYCLDNQNLSCPLHASSSSSAQNLVDCFCDPAFKNSTNRTEENFCEECPVNSYCTGRGAVEFCVPNAIAPVQSASYTACTCDLGWKGVNNTPCVACQSPTYCYGGVQAQCSEGTFSTPLAFDRLNCSCIPGRWGPKGGPCILCSAGKYNLFPGCVACSNTTDLDCTTCALGTASTMLGRDTVCDTCEAGKYSHPANQRGALTCEWCGIGLAAPEGSSNCTTCAVGYYAAAGFSACVICPAGTFATGLVSACSTCAAGMYATQTGATTCQNCSTCSVGQYNMSNCNSSANVVCAPCANPLIPGHFNRYYFTGRGFNGMYSCPYYCNPGLFGVGTGGGTGGCYYCSANEWCLYNLRNMCPLNSAYPMRSSSQTNCKCNAGYYGDGGWNNTWQNFPVGTQTQPPANWSGVNCEVCPTGKYNTGTGITTSAGCVSCVAGTYSTAVASSNSSSCISCLAGTYSSGTAIDSSSACAPCSTGRYSTGVGMTTSNVCENCSVCQIGQYNVSNCNSGANIVCGNCSRPVVSVHETRITFLSSGVAGQQSCSWCCNPGLYLHGFPGFGYGNYQCIGVGISASWALCGVRYYCPDNSRTYTVSPGTQTACTCNAGYVGVGGWSNTWQNFPVGVQLQPPDNWSGVNCEICPAGTYNTGVGVTTSASCLSCIAGTYSTAVASSSASSCISCLAGTYSTGTAMVTSAVCASCMAGTYSSGTGVSSSVSCTTCVSGTYSTGIGMTIASACQNCSVCQTGQYVETNCTSSANITCNSCIGPLADIHRFRYYFTGVGFNGPSSCPWFCTAGYHWIDNFCLSCGNDGWCIYNTRTQCPPNSGVTGFVIASQTSCRCNAGFFGVGGWNSSWQQYPVGTQTQPPAGWSGVNCESCQAGKYGTGIGVTMSSLCTNCISGTYSTVLAPPSSTTCLSCLSGTYSSGTGASSSVSCTACISGTYSTNIGSSTASTCLSCQSGTYQSINGASSSSQCTLCQAGTYSTGTGAITSLTCQTCLAGKFSTGQGSTNSNTCHDCEPGTFSTLLGAISSLVCGSCTAGNFASASGSVACSGCLAGTFSLTRASACTNCSQGTFSSSQASACAVCQPGFFALDGAVSCTPCPAGSFNERNGSSNCSLCDTGSYSFSSMSACLQCGPGKYKPHEGCIFCLEPADDCYPCYPGSASAMMGRSTFCDWCKAGTYSYPANTPGAQTCEPCGNGTISMDDGASDCIACTLGRYAPVESSACLECPIHTFLEERYKGSEQDCQPCARGTYSPFRGVPSRFACTACPAGTYESSRQCIPCQEGTYSPADGFTLCLECKAGSYSAGGGNTRCERCPLGKYTPVQSSSCQDCPFHTYLDSISQSSIQDCIPCPPGTYSLVLGAPTEIWCTPCLPGTYELSRTCQACSAGTFSNAARATTCMPCLPPTYSQQGASSCKSCPAGGFLDSSFTCISCAAGTYSVGGVTVCEACSIGTFSLQNSSTCLFCQPGAYSSSDASSSCELCGTGTFVSQHGSSQCFNCFIGRFSNESGQSGCRTCVDGTFSAAGSTQVKPESR